MKTVCQKDDCTGCMACIEICPRNAINIVDDLISYNAVINEEQCVNCDLCRKTCQNNGDIRTVHPIMWKQGWALNDKIRSGSSSGGAAQAIELAFVKSGGIVCSCIFENGVFGFSFAETEEDVKKFCGSKYVKSTPYGVYKKIVSELKVGKQVLFVGLPCQVAAVKNYVGTACIQNLYTIDLICHGSPSPELLNIFLKQHNVDINEIKKIQFRTKTKFQLKENEKYLGTKGMLDRYSMAFLNGICYTENCYKCRYAKLERVSDISLGDSWGSELSENEQHDGISLLLSQTAKGNELIEKADLKLLNVNLKNAVEHNHQLRAPSSKPLSRENFFKKIKNGENFDSIVKKFYPKQCAKQFVKKILIGMKIMGGVR